ncbi:MAG TPA: hypothetical protein VNU28_05350, partial [Solirubrobacteraceae bacterium]|nr:hypothetical protein [Solirubrobacteraceae bacterium]
MAVDNASGDVYVSDSANNRVEKFDQSGKFLLGWGWGVIPTGGVSGADEFQVCTSATGCRRGAEDSSGAGAFDLSAGVAVDQGTGDVYVVDFALRRVEKFDSSGKFLLMFGGHVNKNGANVCTAAEAAECQGGAEGAGDSEFSMVYERAYIAVGPGGDVYVGDKARVQIFEPSGAWKQNISLSALSSEGHVTALAVNAAGDVFVKDEGAPGVREFEAPLYLESPTTFDEGSETVLSVALDGTGDLFVSDGSKLLDSIFLEEGSFKEYGPSGQQLEAFGAKTLTFMKAGMAFDEALKEVLVYGTDAELQNPEYGHSGVWAFPLPAPGPSVEPGSERATPGLRGAATFEALVDPEGGASEAHFEYVDEAHFLASGYAGAASTSPESIGSSFEDQHAAVQLPQKTLVPGAAYHWRIVVHSAQGTSTGADQVLEEIPAAQVEGPSATSATSTSVTLQARIDPLGAETSYRLEYGTSTTYGHVFSGNVGEGMGYVPLAYHVQGLEAHTVYHYRLVTESEVGTIVGADRTFTTQVPGGSLALPDGRAWELVSPPDKGGALVEDVELSQAASDGSGIAYAASEPLGEGVVGHVGDFDANFSATANAMELSKRGADGWRTHDISPEQSLPPEGTTAVSMFAGDEAFYAFSPDLSVGIFEPKFELGDKLQSAQASEATLYLRGNTSESYMPLVTAANVPPGTKWAPHGVAEPWEQMVFLGSTPDLSHIVFGDWAALTPEAITEEDEKAPGAYFQNLYEWSGGQLQLVNILPDGKTEPRMGFGGGSEEGGDVNPWAMSSDGRYIVMSSAENEHDHGEDRWYVRDMVGHKTVRFGHPKVHTRFETMSRDGSRLFYLESEPSAEHAPQTSEGELYMFDPASEKVTPLTADHLSGERSARVQNALLGTSEDGSYVYFVARGVLAGGASSGQNNLYVMHEEGGTWRTTFIATLSHQDELDWITEGFGGTKGGYRSTTSRVTPNGRYLTFMSNRPLTGYDNTDALSGEADQEVFLYDAQANRLVCASCNPSGARPTGVHDVEGEKNLLIDQPRLWSKEVGETGKVNSFNGNWLAALIPPRWHFDLGAAVHSTSYLFNNGRLFFNSSDALVPQDTNGVADVYEYEPPG